MFPTIDADINRHLDAFDDDERSARAIAAESQAMNGANFTTNRGQYRTRKTSGGSIDTEAGKVVRAWCRFCKRADDIPYRDWRGVVHTCGRVIAATAELGDGTSINGRSCRRPEGE